MINVIVSVESTVYANKGNPWSPRTFICENIRYLKSVVDDSVLVRDEIISVMDTVSTNVTNIISTNVTSTLPMKSWSYYYL